MTERERWVVYPLLFLALGAALRDKLVDRTVTKRIECQELSIVDGDSDGRQPPHVFAKIGRTEATATSPSIGYLYVNGEVAVDGGVQASLVNAEQYAYRGFLLMPQGEQPRGRQQPKSAPAAKPPASESNVSPSKSNSSDAPPKN
jgi:hypothetical protein